MQKLNPNTETVKTSLSIEQEMVDQIAEAVEWLEVTKSYFIRKAIRSEIKKTHKKMGRHVK